MPMPAYPEAEATFAAALNSDPFDAESNPTGLGQGGHRTLFPAGMDAMVALALFSKLAGEYLDTLAEQVETDAASAAAGSGTEASVENIRSGQSAQYLSIRRVWDAAAPVPLVDAATIAVDLATGINFAVTLAGHRTLGNPTNVSAGQSGFIIVTQDATGGRDLAKASNWKVAGGEIVLDLAPGAKNVLAYYAESPTSILLTVSESFA